MGSPSPSHSDAEFTLTAPPSALPSSPLCLSASLPEVSGGPPPLPEGLRLLAAGRLGVPPGLHQRQEGGPVSHRHPQTQAARQRVAAVERPGRRPSQPPLPNTNTTTAPPSPTHCHPTSHTAATTNLSLIAKRSEHENKWEKREKGILS